MVCSRAPVEHRLQRGVKQRLKQNRRRAVTGGLDPDRGPMALSGPDRARQATIRARRLHLFSVKAASQAKAARYDWWLGFVACLKVFTVKSVSNLKNRSM